MGSDWVISHTLAGPGRVLGGFINDTLPAPAWPGRFIGLFGHVFSGRAGPGFRPDQRSALYGQPYKKIPTINRQLRRHVKTIGQ